MIRSYRTVLFSIVLASSFTSLAVGAPQPPPEFAESSKASAAGDAALATAVETTELNLAGNFFDSNWVPGERWLSVAPGRYAAQFYARDTFVTANAGAAAGPGYRADFRTAVDFFSSKMDANGYVPIWFRGTDEVHYFCPYNKTPQEGGVRQYDHVAQFIQAIALLYAWSGDVKWLARYEPAMKAAWSWLASNAAPNGLVVAKVTPQCGSDWADTIQRGGFATFLEVSWYDATRSVAYAEAALGNTASAAEMRTYAKRISRSINAVLYKTSTPANVDGRAFGHYVAWIDGGTTSDYFEVDSNAYAIEAGIAPHDRAASIMQFIEDHADYLINPQGAARVLFGIYPPSATFVPAGAYHNGGYWYITTLHLARAFRRLQMADALGDLLGRLERATVSEPDGLVEWYGDGGSLGQSNYSWSLASVLDVVFREAIGIREGGAQLTLEPCLTAERGPIDASVEYRGSMQTLRAEPGCPPERNYFLDDAMNPPTAKADRRP